MPISNLMKENKPIVIASASVAVATAAVYASRYSRKSQSHGGDDDRNRNRNLGSSSDDADYNDDEFEIKSNDSDISYGEEEWQQMGISSRFLSMVGSTLGVSSTYGSNSNFDDDVSFSGRPSTADSISWGESWRRQSRPQTRGSSDGPKRWGRGAWFVTVDEDQEGEKEAEEEEEKPKCIYLDYNGTTPIYPQVLSAMMPFLTKDFGNPSSSHYFGGAPKKAIVEARKAILELLYPNQLSRTRITEEQNAIIFTGCGTEADNLAIHLAIEAYTTTNMNNNEVGKNNESKKKKSSSKHHIVTSNVEHPAIVQYLKAMEKKNIIDVTYVAVDTDGIVPAADIINAIRPNTILVTLMLANNESGSLQPVKQIAHYCRSKDILFHTDAAQAVGKVNVALDESGIGSDCIDMITIVGHKFGAPKGVACLYIRPSCFREKNCPRGGDDPSQLQYMLLGGGQESGRRGGTENVPYIVGLGAAASMLTSKPRTLSRGNLQWKENASKMETLRGRLLQNLTKALGKDIVRANGPKDPSKRLPNTLSVGLKNVHSGELLKNIQMSVACSAGSACHSSGGKLSAVLVAMNVPLEYARGTLRLSVGPNTTTEEVDIASKIIIEEVKRQQEKTTGP